MNKFGIHCPNKGFRELEAMLTLGVDNFTLLHPEAWLVPRIREHRPQAVILVRHYLTDWPAHDPLEWARECAGRAQDLRPWTCHHTLANEQNLPQEGGGASREWYERIDAWNFQAITEFRRLCPWAKIHWPALASGHSEDQDDIGDGTIGYELCRRSIELADILDHHDYWFRPEELYDAELAEWYAFRFVRAHAFFPEKPIFISECGWFGHNQDPAAAEHYLNYFRRLYDYPYVIGATPFIWDTGEEHPGQAWVGNQTLISAITAAPKQGVSYPHPPFTGGRVRLVERIPESLVSDWRGALPMREDVKPYPRRERLSQVQGVVIHWADDTGRDYGPLQIARYQTGPDAHLPFPQIAYHLMVRQDGEVLWLLPLEAISWHVGPYNRDYLSLLAQPPKGAMWTEAQVCSLRAVLSWLEAALGKVLTVKLHRELRATRCPGPFGEKLLAALEKGVEERRRKVVRKIKGLLAQVDELLDEL